MANAGKGMRREGTAAILGGDAAIATFIQSGYRPAVTVDPRSSTSAAGR